MTDTVELIGGERDGTTFEIPDAASMPSLVVPLPSRPVWIGIGQLAGVLGPYPVVAELPTARYRRTVISEDTHRWRYVLDA
jgi:hypothetical protein